MRFSRLRLNGFKSFVDPTDLVIREGLTGVVGPNGCGKSNLLEALRWVMGENRPSAMRGGGMEDVIFAGSSSRPARNFAEVALVLDNSERLAPAGFNESDTLEIVRRITRDAGSAYKLGGKDVRARDVQMLFADASTGAHSPALVRQGQISELINAKPRARRRVLEEAAGISGLYQRRHEAELRLNATEQNLARVDDVIEQLAAQLAQLARQAKQAARYREIGAALRRAEGILAWRRWQQADTARAAAEHALRECTAEAARTESAAREAAQARETAEQALPPLREEDGVAAAVLQRAKVERDTLDGEDTRARDAIRTLEARIAQLGHDLDRESGLSGDADETIEQLVWESEQLEQAAQGHDTRLEEAAEAARLAAAELARREAELDQHNEDVARLAARHQSASRMRDDARAEAEAAAREMAKAEAEAEAAQSALSHAETEAQDAGTAQTRASATAESAETTLSDAEAARAEVQTRESEARAARAAAEGEEGALEAEVAALAKLVAREANAGDQLLDKLRVARGYEAAIGAALADDLRAPEIGAQDASGWVALPPYETIAALPEGAEPISEHVEATPALARRLSQIGLVSRDAGAAMQSALRPGQRLVSREGDLWRWDGYRAAAEDLPSAAALRLQQLNRLVELKRDLEDAKARAEGARRAHEMLSERLSELAQAERMAREARKQADRQVLDAGRALSRAESDRDRAASGLEQARVALQRHREQARTAGERSEQAEAAIAQLDDLDAARGELERQRTQLEQARTTMMSCRAAHDGLRREGEARTSRAQKITQELSGWRHRRDTAATRIGELAQRKDEAEHELAEAVIVPEEIAARRARLDEAIAAAESRRTRAADALAGGERALREATEAERAAERHAGEAREGRARAEARLDAERETLAQIEAQIAEQTGAAPADLVESLELTPDELPDPDAAEIEVARLRRARDALGAVNLRAEEDAREIQSEHDTLAAEKADLEAAIARLRSGIAALNREGRERLLTAFEQVNANFSTLFAHLFGGGEAKLVLVESDDPLEAGLEIMCQPPGKKLSTLSLLSGGEQTLTALALIFAVFLANPSPICVLDEVDAPLDDANVARFCDLLDEMTRRTETRFLIITHNAITMSRMDRLFGVTMAEHGVSQLVSVDLKRAEALVA